jgi:hypothetical protein
MATTNILNGTLLAIYVGGVKIDLQLQADLKLTMTPRESRTKDSSSYANIFEGIRDFEITGESEVAANATYGMTQLFTAFTAGTELTIAFKTGVSGDMILTGKAYVSELSSTAGVEENARFSYTFTGNGGLTKS